jgi:hypothetical protein
MLKRHQAKNKAGVAKKCQNHLQNPTNKAGVAKNCQNHLQNPKRKRASSSSSGSDSDSAPIQRQQRAAQGNKLTQQGKKALFIIKNPLFC